ncbi:hypothetical protein Tco_1135953 [Tanacetum coccineum]
MLEGLTLLPLSSFPSFLSSFPSALLLDGGIVSNSCCDVSCPCVLKEQLGNHALNLTVPLLVVLNSDDTLSSEVVCTSAIGSSLSMGLISASFPDLLFVSCSCDSVSIAFNLLLFINRLLKYFMNWTSVSIEFWNIKSIFKWETFIQYSSDDAEKLRVHFNLVKNVLEYFTRLSAEKKKEALQRKTGLKSLTNTFSSSSNHSSASSSNDNQLRKLSQTPGTMLQFKDVAGNAGGQNRDWNCESWSAKTPLCVTTCKWNRMLLMNAHENGVVLDEEQLLFLTGEQVTNFDDDVFEADQCDAFDSDVDEAPTTQTMFMYTRCKTMYNKNYVVDSDADYTSDSNIIPYDQYVEDNEEHVVQINVSSVRNDALMSILDEMHEQGLPKNLTKLAKLESLHQEAPDFNSFFKIKNLEHQIQEKDNVIRDLKVLVSNVNDRSCEPYNANDVTALIEQNECVRVELEEVKQHYKELFESIQITRASTNEKTSSLLTQIEDLKAQLEGNLKVAARSSVKTKVLAPGMYAIDVEPIPPRLKNNRNAHLTYINHLKESVETVREIVEEARVVKPLDNVLNYACQYTKLSQELVEYVIGTCPKEFTERDSKAPSIPLTRKKQVTFTDTCSTSTNNTQKHGVHQKTQPSNVQVIPSTGVSSSTRASGSKPRSNTKHNRILPAKSVNNKKVEDHPRTNKSVWTKVNRVDSSISSKHVVINSNSESVCKTCNKCLNSANHEMCVVNILSSVNATPTVKIVLNKGKQIWKPKGKLSDNSLNKTKQVWKATGKLFANVGYQWRPTGKKFSSGKLNCGYQWRPTGKKFALGELCPLTRLPVTCGTDHPLVSGLRLFKTRFRGMNGLGPEPIMMTPGQLISGLAPSPVPATTYIPPTDKDLEILFQPMFNEYFDQSTDGEPVPTATVVNAPIVSTNTSVSTTIAQDAPSTSRQDIRRKLNKKFKGIQTLTPAKQEAADIMKALKESKKMSKRQARTGGSNEGTGPAPSLMTPGYISLGFVQNSVSPTPYVPPSKKDYEILAVDPVGSPSSTTIDQDEQSTSTSPTNQEIQSQVTHQGPVPQFMAPDHSSSGPVLHEMMSDHNSSDLAPQHKRFTSFYFFRSSVENVSSRHVLMDKRRDYDNSDRTPRTKLLFLQQRRTDSVLSTKGLEFLFSPLLEEYYNPTYGQAEENNTIIKHRRGIDFRRTHLLCCSLEAVGFCCHAAHKSFQIYSFDNGRENGISYGSTLKERWFKLLAERAKYALEILKKHNMDNCHSIGTPLATKPKLDVDLSGEPVDQSDYHSKIGSLMYLTLVGSDLCKQYAIVHVIKTDNSKAPQGDQLIMPDALILEKGNSGGIQFLQRAEYVALSAVVLSNVDEGTQLQIMDSNYNKIRCIATLKSAIAISCNPVTTILIQSTSFTRYPIQRNRIGMRCLTPDRTGGSEQK